MPKFRKKPVVIEATQFPADSTWEKGATFMDYPLYRDGRGVFLQIETLEGRHRADAGDWIITGVAGERYPCKPGIFEQTYEPVEATDDNDWIQGLAQKLAEMVDGDEAGRGIYADLIRAHLPSVASSGREVEG